MPPEYIQKHEITSKHDVFRLGVIIVRIVAGDEGYSKCACMSSQEFLEHVWQFFIITRNPFIHKYYNPVGPYCTCHLLLLCSNFAGTRKLGKTAEGNNDIAYI
jgi:hypothetical protein